MAVRHLIASALIVLAAAAGAGAQNLVIHKNGTREYHRAWCPAVRDGAGVVALTLGQANARGLKPHAACDKEPPNASSGDDVGPPKATAPVFVHVEGGKYYHREDCSKLVGPAKRESLETAAKKYWPCPACRPPVRKKSDAPAAPQRGTRG